MFEHWLNIFIGFVEDVMSLGVIVNMVRDWSTWMIGLENGQFIVFYDQKNKQTTSINHQSLFVFRVKI